MSVEQLSSKQAFVSSVISDKSNTIIVVVFTDASEESKSLLTMVEKAKTKSGPDVKYYTVDFSTVAEVASKLGAEKAPVTVIYKGGAKAKSMTGVYGGPELKAAIDELRA